MATIRVKQGLYRFECVYCHRTQEVHMDTAEAAKDVIRRSGVWERLRRPTSGWTCAECARDFRLGIEFARCQPGSGFSVEEATRMSHQRLKEQYS